MGSPAMPSPGLARCSGLPGSLEEEKPFSCLPGCRPFTRDRDDVTGELGVEEGRVGDTKALGTPVKEESPVARLGKPDVHASE